MEQITITQKEFDSLPEYSCSLPTGTTIGKRWKRGFPYGRPTQWYIGEYVESKKPGYVDIQWKKIVAIFRLKKTAPAPAPGR